ncbi:DUF1573 domain-containing protein [Mucilaginibacter sp. HMF5004]|uniref:DUF1573 domain-containing protein n=1 Tax=Mucilaginibacter rivuli TaxID=2857527 RepID=UPI001C5DE426|nr:DUF1573 domain-containing protein [Mucilaginibacter rivuli]MBW4891367.1 DUF1573 domain-containing protein [Mucilaginibacter rivuli]
MRKLFFGLVTATMLMACHQTNKTTATAGEIAAIKFTEDKFDFGKIKEGDSVMHKFAFINNGKSPLIITDAVATCGCTKPEWPKEPIQPGDKGEIKVTFHSAGKKGIQDKMITVTGNTNPAQSMVHLTGEVTEK